MMTFSATEYTDSEVFLNFAAAAGQHYIKPYTETRGKPFCANFTYRCKDGSVILRPNHNMANILRTLKYINPVLRYLSSNGNDEAKALVKEIDEQEYKKILLMQLFYTSGRTNEAGFFDHKEIAQQLRERAGKNFKTYFLQYIAENGTEQIPFKSKDEIEHYSQLLDQLYVKNGTNKDKAIRLILLTAHELDLLRCFPEKRLKRSIFKTLNSHSTHPNNRDMQKLILYVQRCIIATGDMLRTEYKTSPIPGVHEETSFSLNLKASKHQWIRTGNRSIVRACRARVDEIYQQSSSIDKDNIDLTLKRLDKVIKPFYFKENPASIELNPVQAIELIRSGNAMSRTFNGDPRDMSLRFEIEQLTNPKYVRPIREKKLNKKHNLRINLRTKQVVEYPEHDYVPLEKQHAIRSIDDLHPKKTVSKQNDRGKPKNTVFAKKCSYSLVPKSGLFPVFEGRLQDKFYKFSKFTPVGLLHDSRKMNLKQDKYLWYRDVRSSGIDGFFWLPKDKKSTQYSNIPALNQIRNDAQCKDLNELKARVNQANSSKKYSEILAGGSLDSLKAIFILKDSKKHLLAGLHTQCVLKHDYNIERPLIILDGKNEPRICKQEELKNAYVQIKQQQKRWWNRLINWFVPTQKAVFIRSIDKMNQNIHFTSVKDKAGISYQKVNEQLENHPSRRPHDFDKTSPITTSSEDCTHFQEREVDLLSSQSKDGSPLFFGQRNSMLPVTQSVLNNQETASPVSG